MEILFLIRKDFSPSQARGTPTPQAAEEAARGGLGGASPTALAGNNGSPKGGIPYGSTLSPTTGARPGPLQAGASGPHRLGSKESAGSGGPGRHGPNLIITNIFEEKVDNF